MLRTTSHERAARAVLELGGQPRVVVSGNHATPWSMVDALDAAVPEWILHMLNAQPGVPCRDGVLLETCFIGPGMRDQPTLSYVPSRLSAVPVLLGSRLRPDVVVVHVAPARRERFSLGIEVNILPAAIEACRASGGLVIAVVNSQMPYTLGDALVSADDIDFVVEHDAALSAASPVGVDEAARIIGQQVAVRIGDGATLQVGIGAIPDAALAGLVNRRGLRVWSEMASDEVLALDRAGALDPDSPVVASFLLGGPELYAWAAGSRVRMMRTETTNDPALIAAQPAMTSINAAMQVDLFAQANAASIGSRTYSGFGGQPDFVAGALHSSGGQALIALLSWHTKADRSTIVPLLQYPVTSFQHTAVITEHGTAELSGRDQQAQATALIDRTADPRVRDYLRTQRTLAPRSSPL